MDITDYGQVEIYDKLFENLDVRGNALQCIEEKRSYSALHKGIEIPIMIGSKYDKGPNPLAINGYFIVDGLCKTINNIKLEQEIGFGENYAIMMNKDRIKMESMFNFTITERETNKEKVWALPLNWEEITKYSKNKDKIYKYLLLIEKYGKKRKVRPIIKNEIDKITLCYMFECWLKLREIPKKPWRLVTAGEVIEDCIKRKRNPMECFRENKWNLKHLKGVTTVSENMKNYNIVSDIEAIRKVTIAHNRELADRRHRIVNDEDKYKLCPVQTSDGAICGTVNYLCLNAKVITETKDIEINKGKGSQLFVNSIYKGEVDNECIDILKKNKFMVFKYGILIYAYFMKGFLEKGDSELSYAVSLLPFRKYNPPIRSMFASSMLKQSIDVDTRNLLGVISGVKCLEENVKPLNVAIMMWYGYNIEDAIVISRKTSKMYRNKRSDVYREKNSNIFKIYVNEKEKVKTGQPLLKIIDASKIKTVEVISTKNEGTVKSIEKDENYTKIVIESIDDLQVGDKMSSLHGQKGVVSLIEDNMPYYIENGKKIEIDLIINPHAFPSRMTMGQLKEMEAKEVKINNIKNPILVGKCIYISLRQQVKDKYQNRNGGRYDSITRQPVAGKKNNGGLRFGQMERDILIALNAWKTIEEIWTVDRVRAKFCGKTGMFNPNCCYIYRYINQSSLMCLSLVRALGYDILYRKNEYKIDVLDTSILPKTDTLNFGENDPTDVRIKDNIIILPECLRNNVLKKLYYGKNIEKINKEVSKILRSKNGVYHQNIEGHVIDKCIRSVITPNPKLEINEIEVPIGTDIDTNYGILNRQPTLNTGSMKLMKIRYSKDKTIKLNPLVCKLFNADFDGDEMNVYIVNAKEIDEPVGDKCQDYILADYLGFKNIEELTEYGVTANKQGIELMIKSGSKGKQLNYTQIYEKVNKIEGCFNEGLNNEQWYELCKEARVDICSIAINTPVTGHLQSLCNQRFI